MMKNIWGGVVVLLFLVSCQNPSAQIQEKELTDDKKLVHQVYFNLKTDLPTDDKVKFEEALKSLSKIEGVKHLRVGESAETGDSRLVSDYDYVLTMDFETMDDLKSYAKDEFHMDVKKEVGPMLAKAPIVYDFWLD